MSDCHAIDDLITVYVDHEASGPERAFVARHLAACVACRSEVEAEAAARHVLRAHAAVARTMGGAPSFRPHAFRLGRPALVATRTSVAAIALVAAIVAGAVVLRPRTVEAVGIIGDSSCGATHPHAPGDAEGRGCVLNCVRRGAQFVLVSGPTIYRIENQEFPNLAAFANMRVTVTGTMGADAIKLSQVDGRDSLDRDDR